MGIAAQLMKPVYLRESSVEIGEESAASNDSSSRSRPQNGGQDADVIVEDSLETLSRTLHEISAEENRMRWATARAYSRQTSSGAS